jgi:hypothetical protein
VQELGLRQLRGRESILARRHLEPAGVPVERQRRSLDHATGAGSHRRPFFVPACAAGLARHWTKVELLRSGLAHRQHHHRQEKRLPGSLDVDFFALPDIVRGSKEG